MMTKRRTFLKTSATAAAGLGISSSLSASFLAPSSVLGANDKITVALIGCRNQGWWDLEDILKQSNVVCLTLCDVDGSVLADKADQLEKMGHPKPNITMDYRVVLEDKDIDAVIIGTPDHWHCLPAVEACEAGKHVYIEKPLANSVGEINVMLDAARKYKSLVQVGQQQRSGAHWKSAIEFVKSGKLGTIRQVKFWGNFNYGAGNMPVPDSDPPAGVDYDRWLGPAPLRPFNKNRFHGSWRMFRDYGGGLLSDWGVHLLDMGLWAMDVKNAPLSVQSLGGNFANTDRALEMPDTLTVLYEMEGYNMVWEHNGGIERGPYDQGYGVKFIGSNGTLVADREKWRVFPEGSGEEWRMEAMDPQPSDHKSHLNHCENFIRAIRYGDSLNAEIEYGHRSALFAHLGNISYWADHRVVYDEKQRRITSSEKADALLTPAYRAPWKFPTV
ncbi:MAG: Gfo/Idh/MocA family oxidoreductase [Bacteroidia bacterium]|nr:MAG: Gfo/Idh/MocA family oxidoreductase [Bacteroidia bacterium]